MALTPELTASLEAINFQSGMLFKELTLAIDEIRREEPSKYGTKLSKSNIAKIVERHTGLKITMEYSDVPFANAWVMPPLFDKNHPLLNEVFRFDEASLEGLAMVRSKGGLLEGEVNRETSKVTGFFTSIVSPVTVTKGLFASEKFTSDEIAAIIIHELGHLFTYYEYLGSGVTTNYVLQSVSREITESREIRRKYKVIEEANNVLGINIEDPEALIKSKDEGVIQTVVLAKVMEKTNHELGSKTYDATAWEMLSDQFSNRHGAGRSLVTGLAKMSQSIMNTSAVSTPTFLLVEAMKAVLIVGGIMAMAGLVPIAAYLLADHTYDSYDKTRARIDRIRNDLVGALKSRDITREVRDRILKDLEVIDEAARDFKDRRTLIELIHTTVWSGRRKQYQQKVFQQELEVLARNELFVKASKFDSLIK